MQEGGGRNDDEHKRAKTETGENIAFLNLKATEFYDSHKHRHGKKNTAEVRNVVCKNSKFNRICHGHKEIPQIDYGNTDKE